MLIENNYSLKQNGNPLSGSSLLGNLADGAQPADSPSNLSDGLDEEDDELLYNDEATLDNEDGASLSGSSNGYSFSEALSPSSQTETNAQTSIATILGASNTASLMSNMNNVLNSVLNGNGARQVKSERGVEQEENNLPTSPESASSVNEEAVEK